MQHQELYFYSPVEIITVASDLDEIVNIAMESFYEQNDSFQQLKSGWRFKRVEFMDIHINPYNPISASSYIELPAEIKKSKSVINVKNLEDHKCFIYSVASAVYPKEKNPQRLDKFLKTNVEKFNCEGMDFPVSISEIDKFEKQNEFAITVIGYDNGEFIPLRVSKKKDVPLIRLLLISDETGNQHYCWIKNISRLLVNINKHHGRKYFCDYCLNFFNSESVLNLHLEICSTNAPVRDQSLFSGGGGLLELKYMPSKKT